MDQAKYDQRMKMQAILHHLYPHLFRWDNRPPLAIGIFEDICRDLPKISKTQLREFLRWWCSRRKYRDAVMADGAVRVGIDGNPTDPISERDREHTSMMIEIVKARANVNLEADTSGVVFSRTSPNK